MLRLAFDFIITWRETRTRPNAYLFFCQRKKIPLLFVSLKGMIDDIRFLNLLEESHVDFRCIDFPWFCKENLPLIKAVVLYEKLEIRINV